MKILLMLPIMSLDKLWGKLRYGAGNNNFNNGLASIAAYLIQQGYEVDVLDPQFLESMEEFDQYLKRGQYEVVGVSTYTPTITDAYKTIELCRKTLPSVVTVMGGPHCSFYPQETLQSCDELDFVVSREGEETMKELTEWIDTKSGKAPESILGLTYRNDKGEIVRNGDRPFLDIDSLPMPAYNKFPLEKYKLQPTIYKRLPTFATVASRGCPYPCTFCHAFEVHGYQMRYRDPELFTDELEYMMKDFGARGFMFHDSTFTLNRKWVEVFCETILRRNLDITWYCLTRADRVTEELLKLMKRAGCYGMSYGVESSSQKTLDFLEKKLKVEDNIRAIKLGKDLGLFMTATYMIGLPGEEEKDVLDTIEFAKQNKTHIAHFFWPNPLPSTKLFQQCKEDGGLMENPQWENFNKYAGRPVYVNPRIGYERMKKIQGYAYRSYYTSPRVLGMNLRTINSWTDIKKYFNAGLAITGMWSQ